MNAEIAKQIGSGKTFKRSLAVIIAWLLFILLFETRGDFANGFIFYLQSQLDPPVLMIYILILAMAFFFGRRAGLEILNTPGNYLKTGVKYALITSLIVICYWTAVGVYYGGMDYTLGILPIAAAIITGILMLAWLWSVRHIRQEIEYRQKNHFR